MKKTSILFISIALVLLFATSALAAQASYYDSTAKATYFSSTTVSTLSSTYSVTYNLSNLERLHSNTKFDATDGATNYPYEIYLPSETNPNTYRIHTNYTRNTDACASCHATHTAVGPSLLQWYTVYETCIACHDGTVATTYDVVNGTIGTSAKPTYGGHFGIGTEDSLSNHNVTGAVTIAAAPGGSVAGKDADRGYGVKYRVWEATFGCESCHTPHGQGGNARILNPDPNGYATLKNKHDDLTINVVGTIGRIVYLNNNTEVPIITGYPYKPTLRNAANADITQSFIFRNDGQDSTSGAAYTYVVDRNTSSGASLDQIASIENAVIPYQVRMDIDNYLGFGGNFEKVKHISGINDYCGACHVDYNTEPNVLAANGGNGVDKIMADKANRPGYGVLTGEFSKAHRHAVGLRWNYAGAADTGYIGYADKPMMTQGAGEDGNDIASETAEPDSYISCLTCHFAHGTSKSFWTRFINNPDFVAAGYSPWTDSEMHEISGSSALKRLPNMGTCEACHQKGIDAQGYNINTAQVAQDQTENLVPDGIFALGNFMNKQNITNSTCEGAACHNGMVTPFTKTLMGDGDGQDVSCEKCHIAISGAGSQVGSSGNHIIQPSAKNIINARNLTTAEQSAICLSCHSGGVTDAKNVLASWNSSSYKASGVVSCTTCHDVHKKSIEDKTLKREVNALCASCHNETKTINFGNFHQ